MIEPFDVFEAGPMTTWADHTFSLPEHNFARNGMQFLQEKLHLNGAEVSVNVFVPGQGMPFAHRHKQNEELYIFLSGTGEMTLDEKTIPITSGTCVRVSPRTARIWKNTGSEPLTFLVIQYLASSVVGPTVSDGEMV